MEIKKTTLWKTGFIVLCLIVLIFIFNPFKSSSGAGLVDVSLFTNNQSLYPSLGPDNATNVVIEISDFQCPICGIASALPNWSSQYSNQKSYNIAGKIENAAKQGKLRLISVIMSFLGQGSVYAAEAALCANEQGKFWEMHDTIYSNQVPPSQEGIQFTKSQLETIAQGVSGLDQTKFSSCLEGDKHLSDVQKISGSANSIGVKGTPTFIINGKMLLDWTSALSVLSQ